MRATPTASPARGAYAPRLCLVAAALVVVALPACTGDNLFFGVGTSGPQRPDVDITAPQDNFTMNVTDSVLVTANLSSSSGVASVKYSGLSAGGQAVFNDIPLITLPNPRDTTVSRYMKPTATGNARLIVEATDILGELASDTVDVIVN